MKWLFPFWLMAVLCRFSEATPRYYGVVRSFGFAEQTAGQPVGDLCLASDGRFYGVATQVGATIFSTAQDGTDYRVLHRGDAAQVVGRGLIEGSNGRLYGFGSAGLYSLRKDGSDFWQWEKRDLMWIPAKLLEGSDGLLYGTSALAGGSAWDVFRVGKDGTGFQILHQFSSRFSINSVDDMGELIELPGGNLIGIDREGAGGIYRMNLDGSDYRLIQEFSYSTNAPTVVAGPTAPLTLIDGKLFGAANDAAMGGSCAFSVGIDGSGLKVLHALSRDTRIGFVKGPSGKIYGSFGFSDAKIFEMDPDGGNYKETAMYDGVRETAIIPNGRMVAIGDRLCGLATDAASNPIGGYLFDFRPGVDGNARILRRLWYSGGDGRAPYTLVYSSEGMLYGTCLYGGEIDNGILWKMAEDGGNYQVLRQFDWREGSPNALMEGPNGWLYGLFQNGYPIDHSYSMDLSPTKGSVFRVSKTGEGFEILRAHTVEWPSSVMAGKDGRVYVTVSRGKESSSGAYIYSMREDGSDYVELVRLQSNETERLGQLLEASDGSFFVTADRKIFRISRNGVRVMIHDQRQYRAPYALVEGTDGGIYGSNNTPDGFFRINKDGTGYTKVRASGGPLNFIGKRMVEIEGGKFIGLNDEWIFRVGPGDAEHEYLRWMESSKWGKTPMFGLVKGAGGAIYGVTGGGGELGLGTVFRLGAPTEAPELAIMFTNGTNTVISARGSLGTRLRLETSRSPEGPWKDDEFGDYNYIDVGGAKMQRNSSTNVFYRARLLEY